MRKDAEFFYCIILFNCPLFLVGVCILFSKWTRYLSLIKQLIFLIYIVVSRMVSPYVWYSLGILFLSMRDFNSCGCVYLIRPSFLYKQNHTPKENDVLVFLLFLCVEINRISKLRRQ